MSSPTVLSFGPLTLTRVLYIDAAVPPDVMGITVADLASVPWAGPQWAADDQVRVGAAAWVVDAANARVVLDPFMAADDILHDAASATSHQRAITASFAEAGLPVETVTRVVVTHIEGIGMIAVRDGDGWRRFFPNARISASSETLAEFERSPSEHWSSDGWRWLRATGLIDTYGDGAEIVPGMTMERTRDHNPGHYAIHFRTEHDGDGPAATFIGHLAISPLHLSTGPCAQQHLDPRLAWENLHAYADDGRILIGPLWPSPGAGTWSGDTFAAVGG